MPPSSNRPARPINLLKHHRPKIQLKKAPIPQLSPESRVCLRTLATYRRHKSALGDVVYPRSRCAAVLVALFVGRMGDLYVLLNRRSSGLRTYAGDTSLPGGKVESTDKTLEDTARREAFEEIGLPRDPRKVPLLCVLEPFVASNQTIVTPVVVLILDNTLRPILNEAEVTSLFSHPLTSFLSSSPPFPSEPESLHVPYHSYVDFPWPPASVFAPSERPLSETQQQWASDDDSEGDGQDILDDDSDNDDPDPFLKYHPSRGKGKQKKVELIGKGAIRMHRFLTGREAGGVKPVFGLTASILIWTATVGYARPPAFDVYPPPNLSALPSSSSIQKYTYTFSPTMEQRIAYAMLTNPAFRQSYKEEGIDIDWKILERVADVKRRSNFGAVDGRRDCIVGTNGDARRRTAGPRNRGRIRSKL